MTNFASLSCFYSKLRWGAFLLPLVQNRVPEYPVQNRVNLISTRSIHCVKFALEKNRIRHIRLASNFSHSLNKTH